MDKAELLATFSERVEQFERYQSFIAKAQGQSGKFASAVVEKVIADNESKSMEVVSELVPLMADMESVIDDLRTRRAEALDSSKESQFRLEELELRLAIGDLSEADFNAEASEFKSVVENTESQVAELDSERVRFEEALARWQELGTAAGVLANGAASRLSAGVAGGAAPAPAQEPTFRREPAYAGASNGGGGGGGGGPVGYSIESDPMPQHSDFELPGQSEPELDMVSVDRGPEPIEAFDVGDDAVNFGSFDGQGRDSGFEVDELDLVEHDSDVQLEDGGAAGADKPRRSVLLYQEGTAEEQIYPFTGEVMSLGRGRDNDVQVKNDSKVSRYHCKLYRRGPNFYIEDNKSANGTLVNGELITERRLFGGEEVIIGETFFRFRILD